MPTTTALLLALGLAQAAPPDNPDEALKRFHEANPMKTLGDAWDVAEAAVYLAAPSGKFITGEVVTIDGGMQQWGVVWPAGMPDYFKVEGGA